MLVGRIKEEGIQREINVSKNVFRNGGEGLMLIYEFT